MLQALIAALVLAAPAPGADEQPLPTGESPRIAVVRLQKGDNVYGLVERRNMPVKVTEMRQRKEIVGGQEVVRVEEVTVTKNTLVETYQRFQGLQAFDTAGKQITPEKLPDLLKKDTLVLIAADGNKPDPIYLRIVKEGTIVLVFTPLPAPLPPPAPPAAELLPPPAGEQPK